MKLCKDCAHGRGWKCTAPQTFNRTSFVDGKQYQSTVCCESLREFDNYCGKDARWFEPKGNAPEVAASRALDVQ